MTNLKTLIQMVIATATLVVGSGINPVGIAGNLSVPKLDVAFAPGERTAQADLIQGDGTMSVDGARLAQLPWASAGDGVPWLSNDPGDGDEIFVQRLAQAESDDPLDGPLDSDDDLDEPVQPEAGLEAEEPLDAPLPEEESADETVSDIEPLDAPLDDILIDQTDPDLETLDAPLQDPLDAPLQEPEIALGPVAEPVTTTAPVAASAAPVAKKSSAPVPAKGYPVSSVRKKGAPRDQILVVAGSRQLPADLASCGVAVGTGRATVGVNCDTAPVVAAHQPTIPRVAGSAALVSTDNPSLITSRRDGVQIGEFPEPTLGDSIATTVRAAIFPEDVIVPEVLIVPGEVVVAGNTSREDPIVLWRSELEQAAVETGVPVEMLATVIRVTSDGDPRANSPAGGVGLMHVPVHELVARGISEDQWHNPATNIRVGAELMAAGASPADVQSGAAVTRYLSGSCPAGDACNQPEPSQVSEWIVYYRLRMTPNPGGPVAPAERVAQTAGWPFADEEEEPATDPFARLRQDDDQETDRRQGWPPVRPGGSEDEPEWNWPWSRGTDD